MKEKFGVAPAQILDYLTLIGDTVDNVPGVPKVGPKTADKWLAEHGSLDAIVAHADKITGVVGENLRNTLEWLPKAKQLLTVKCDLTLPYAPDGLAITAADTTALLAFFERFEFKGMANELRSSSLSRERGSTLAPVGTLAGGRVLVIRRVKVPVPTRSNPTC